MAAPVQPARAAASGQRLGEVQAAHAWGAQRPTLRWDRPPSQWCHGPQRAPVLRQRCVMVQIYLALFRRAYAPAQVGDFEIMGCPGLCRLSSQGATASSAVHMLPHVPHAAALRSRICSRWGPDRW